jgi:hypothetical protein
MTKIIDEQFRPIVVDGYMLDSDGSLLTELVKDQMRAEGLDPLNKRDVLKYWKSKGIENVNG